MARTGNRRTNDEPGSLPLFAASEEAVAAVVSCSVMGSFIHHVEKERLIGIETAAAVQFA
jgi:hypothetical protein